MKQKKLNNILYVFDVNPYEITQDTDAEVIKVQEESSKGFVEMNQSLAEKIVKYNYHTMCVNVPEWAPYVEQEDPQGSLTFGIYGSAAADAINQIQLQNADNVILQSWVAGVDLSFPFQTDVEYGQHCVIECKDDVDLSQGFNVTGMEYLPVVWTDDETNRKWYGTLAIVDSISIGINAASPAEITVVAPFGLEIYDEATGEWVEYWATQQDPNFEEAHLVVGRTYSVEQSRGIGQGKVVVFNPECGTGSRGTVGAEFIAPETDLTITLADDPSTHTVEITSDITMAEIMEQTPDHQTIVNTYTSPSSPFNMTVNDGNIVTVEFDNGEPSNIYDIDPNGFFAGQWQNPDTGKYISWSNQIFDDVNVTIATPQPSTYTFVLEGSNIHQNITVKVNDETTSYTPEQLVDGVQLNDGDVIDVYPTQNVSDYSLVSGAVWDTDHWTATVNGADVDIWINYLGAGVNFVASWNSGSTPENVDQINIGFTPVTGSALGDSSWTDTVRLYPGSSNITFFVSTGLPSDMDTFRLTLDGIEHKAHWDIDPQTGDKTVSDDNSGAANPGIWTYNDNPDTGLPYIAFELPALSDDDTPWQDNDTMLIYVQVQGS